MPKLRSTHIAKIVRCSIGIFITFASFSFLPIAVANDLDYDCNPRGWIQKLGAWWDPVEFWSAQPAAIQKEVGNRVKAYEIYLVQRQADAELAIHERERARIEQANLREQLGILGVQPKSISPDVQRRLDQTAAKVDEAVKATYVHIDQAQKKMAESAIQWGEKCIAFSREQLAKTRR